MPYTPRGAPYPTLANAGDVPFWNQQLAEWADAQMQALDDGTFKRAGFTLLTSLGGSYSSASTTQVPVPAFDTTFTRIAGHRYRVTAQVRSSSTVVGDVLAVYLRVDDDEIALFTRPANSSPTQANTAHDHSFAGYYTAPTSGVDTLAQLRFARAVGTGTLAISAGATTPASLLVEDMGVA